MSTTYTIPLSKIVEDFRLEVVVKPDNFEEIQISSPEVNRPGLPLAGFFSCSSGFTFLRTFFYIKIFI